MIVYFVEDIIYFIYKDRVIENQLKNIICNGRIISKDLFMNAFLKIIKKEKIKGKIFGDKIVILKNSFYSNADLYFLESIFNELGYVKVEYLDMKDILPDESATYIEINNHYMVIYLESAIYLDLNYFKDIPKILDYLKPHFKNYVILFGFNNIIPEVRVKNLDVYYLENPQKFILNSLLKVKKYDA